MNTPLMELIEYIQLHQEVLHAPGTIILSKAKKLLEKEREVIQDAFVEGELNVYDLLKRKYRMASDYYTKTFTNESK